MTILVYNNRTGEMETYEKALNDPMPYTTNRYLTVREFRGNSDSNLGWTDRRFMETWNRFREFYGKPIFVGAAFKRIWEGGYNYQSAHYTGGAFDCGQNISDSERDLLYNSALNFGEWSEVVLHASWVHMAKSLTRSQGYPLTRRGSRGVYVCVLQDSLNALGYTGSGIDGYFGPRTEQAVIDFQTATGIAADGIVGPVTWRYLTRSVKGIGLRPTVDRP